MPALAAGGPAVPADYAFVAKLTIGLPGTDDARACTAALVRPRVLVTASSCLTTAAHPDPAAATALPITARFPSGATVSATDVRATVVPGVSAVVLARPVPGAVAPAANAATGGETLTAAGFGRTATDWVTDQAHAVTFTVTSADATGIALAPAGDAGLCRGDAGAPLVRTGADGKPELVALATGAHQKGCFGSADTTGDATAADAIGLAALPAAAADLLDQLTVSPLDSGRANTAGANFGTTVATGDFNKDGYQDFVVGAPQGLGGANATVVSGTVTLFMGGATGPGAGTVLPQTLFGAGDETGDLFGSALATGDFNKDGYADLAIGDPGETIGTIKAGGVAVLYGSATGLKGGVFFDESNTGQTDVAGDGFGSSLASGDFNGDGYADLAIGVPGKSIGSAKSGQVEVVKGSSAGLSKSSPWIVSQTAVSGAANETGDLFGSSVAAGNVLGAKTGTVYADLVVGTPGEAPGSDPQSGIIYVIPGAAGGPVTGGISASQTGNSGSNEAGDRFGATVATGDFDKDGWADIVVGVPGEFPASDPQSGSAIVLGGGSTALAAGYTIQQAQFGGNPNQTGDLFGSAFATGDVNGDGYADVIAGAPGRTGNAGVIYTFLGGATSSTRAHSLTPGRIIHQADVNDTDEAGDRFGAALATADFSKDGKTDVLVGRPGESAPGQPASGAVTMLTDLAGS